MSNTYINAILTLKDKMTQPLDRVSKKLQNSSRTLNKMGKSWQNTGRSIQNVGKSLTTHITAPVVGATVASVKLASDFEKSMAKVTTISGTTGAETKKMEKQILSLSNKTGVAASDIAGNVYDAISAGQKAGDAVRFVGESIKLAKGGFTDTNSALDILTTTLNAYGMKAKDAAKVSDMLINTQNLGKVTVNELASAMGKVIPTANSYNVKLQDLDAGYVVLTKNGVRARQATTYMNSMYNELGKSSKNVAKILKQETGHSFDELTKSGKSTGDVLEILQDYCDRTGTKFTDLWSNANSAKAAAVFTQHSKDYNKALKSMDKAVGTTDSAVKKMGDTLSAKATKSMNRLKNSGIRLGQTFMVTFGPSLEKALKAFDKLMDRFQKMPAKQQQMILKFALIAAAVGPVVAAIGRCVIGIGNFTRTLSRFSKAATAAGGVTNLLHLKFLLIIAVIAAVIAIGVLLYKNWDKIAAFANKVKEKVGAAFQKMKDAVSTKIKAIIDVITGIWGKVKGAIEKVKNGIADIFGANGTKKLTIEGVAKYKGNASGTSNWIGGVTRINEKGGEIVDLPHGTRIIPHDVSMNMAKNSRKNSGRTVVFNMPKLADNLSVRSDADVYAIADAIATKLEMLKGDVVYG